jgi:hypothetical protein
MVSYEINPSSGPVVVQRVRDIRSAEYNEAGDIKSGYKLPDELKGRHSVRQLGIVPKDGKAYVYIQPPGVYIPDFGYGPITGVITTHPQEIKLEGRYDKFPDLPRTKTIFVREIVEDGMPYISRKVFNAIFDGYAGLPRKRSLNGDMLDKLMHEPSFRAALEEVFEAVKFGIDFAPPVRQEAEQVAEHTARTSLPRDYSRPQNRWYVKV